MARQGQVVSGQFWVLPRSGENAILTRRGKLALNLLAGLSYRRRVQVPAPGWRSREVPGCYSPVSI